MLFFIFSTLLSTLVLSKDICSIQDTQAPTLASQAVLCYAGNFLTKMLAELNKGNNKTTEHVRVHLLPYLGGIQTLSSLQIDQPSNPLCTVCYSDPQTSIDLTGLRNLLSSDQIASYDAIAVCYVKLTDFIMNSLDKSEDGVYLKPSQIYDDPFDQVVAMLTETVSMDPSVCSSGVRR